MQLPAIPTAKIVLLKSLDVYSMGLAALNVTLEYATDNVVMAELVFSSTYSKSMHMRTLVAITTRHQPGLLNKIFPFFPTQLFLFFLFFLCQFHPFLLKLSASRRK